MAACGDDQACITDHATKIAVADVSQIWDDVNALLASTGEAGSFEALQYDRIDGLSDQVDWSAVNAEVVAEFRSEFGKASCAGLSADGCDAAFVQEVKFLQSDALRRAENAEALGDFFATGGNLAMLATGGGLTVAAAKQVIKQAVTYCARDVRCLIGTLGTTVGAEVVAELSAGGAMVTKGLGTLDDIAEAAVKTYGKQVGATNSGRPPVTNPTSQQLAAANDLGVDPRWVKADGSIDWPPNNGFVGTPQSQTLQPGTKIDRYGSNNGGFLSPAGTPFDQRALPNSSANSQFQTFEVVKLLPVNSGQAAPLFGKAGGGTQYQLQGANVQQLLHEGYLRVVQ